MKIVLLSGSISSSFATAIILRLKQQGDSISMLIVKKRYTIENIKRIIVTHGFKKSIAKGINKFFLKEYSGKSNQSSHLGEYLENLGYNPGIRLKDVIKKSNIPFIFIRDFTNEKDFSRLRSIRPDIIIYAGGGIIRKELLRVPKIGILNAHMGLLPKYRGMNVLEWSLFNDDPIGITIHFIDEGIDTGDILLRKAIPIEKGDTIKNLRDKSQSISVEALAEVVNKIKNDCMHPIKQKKKDGKQYFVMHTRFKKLVEEKLQKLIASSLTYE